MTPLTGKRILITRPRAQAAELSGKLTPLGAEPVLFPTIEIAPMEDYAALDRAIALLNKYHWVIFTSLNGVAAFWERLALAGQDYRALAGVKVSAIGPATARALDQRGVRVEMIPDEYVAEAIVENIGDVRGQWLLLPRADIAREALAEALGRRGAVVHEIAAYRTLPAAPDAHGLREFQRGVDAITFTSSSTVRNFVALVGQEGARRVSGHPTAIACIGPITAQTARELGLPVDVMAREYTLDGLVAALCHYFSPSELH